MPGQACAYKVGMLKIQELRARAQQELGEKFDQREFHDAVLKNGALPLEILEEQVNDYIQKESVTADYADGTDERRTEGHASACPDNETLL